MHNTGLAKTKVKHVYTTRRGSCFSPVDAAASNIHAHAGLLCAHQRADKLPFVVGTSASAHAARSAAAALAGRHAGFEISGGGTCGAVAAAAAAGTSTAAAVAQVVSLVECSVRLNVGGVLGSVDAAGGWLCEAVTRLQLRVVGAGGELALQLLDAVEVLWSRLAKGVRSSGGCLLFFALDSENEYSALNKSPSVQLT